MEAAAAGADWCDALTASGVLVGGHARRYPADFGEHPHRRRAHELWPWGSEARTTRKCAEHEAAHAVAANELGYRVGEVRVNPDGSGHTRPLEHVRDRVDDLAILIAPSLWFDIERHSVFTEGDSIRCSADRRRFAECGDQFTQNQAIERAGMALVRRRADVLALADRLEELRVINLSGY